MAYDNQYKPLTQSTEASIPSATEEPGHPDQAEFAATTNLDGSSSQRGRERR